MRISNVTMEDMEIRLTVDKRDAGTIGTSSGDTLKIAIKEVDTGNLETLLHYLRSELIHAVLRSVVEDVLEDTATICRSTMLAEMLNAPVSELAVGDDVNVGNDLFDSRALKGMLTCP